MSNPFEKAPGNQEHPKVVKCPDCNGTKKDRKGEKCKRCDGTGKVRIY